MEVSGKESMAERTASVLWVLRLGFWLMLAVATHQTLSPQPMDVFHGQPDTFLHVLCWSSLSAALYVAFRNTGRFRDLLLILFAYSISLEFAQLLVPGRSFDPRDMLSNAAACLGVFVATKVWERLRA